MKYVIVLLTMLLCACSTVQNKPGDTTSGNSNAASPVSGTMLVNRDKFKPGDYEMSECSALNSTGQLPANTAIQPSDADAANRVKAANAADCAARHKVLVHEIQDLLNGKYQ